jgi:hypothetical protein
MRQVIENNQNSSLALASVKYLAPTRLSAAGGRKYEPFVPVLSFCFDSAAW